MKFLLEVTIDQAFNEEGIEQDASQARFHHAAERDREIIRLDLQDLLYLHEVEVEDGNGRTYTLVLDCSVHDR